MDKVKYLIIGAGISGLTFANYIKTDYLILEKESEIGCLQDNHFHEEGSGHDVLQARFSKEGKQVLQEKVQDQCQNRQGDHQEKTEERHLQAESQCQSGR